MIEPIPFTQWLLFAALLILNGALVAGGWMYSHQRQQRELDKLFPRKDDDGK